MKCSLLESQGCLHTRDQLRGHGNIYNQRADPVSRVQEVLVPCHTGEFNLIN